MGELESEYRPLFSLTDVPFKGLRSERRASLKKTGGRWGGGAVFNFKSIDAKETQN